MSNFDFKKLREQVKNTGQTLKESFKGTDAQIEGNENRSKSLKGRTGSFTGKKRPEHSKKMKNLKKTNSWNEKIKESNIRRLAKPIMSPDGQFESLTALAKHYNKSTSTVQYWLKSKPTEFYYVKL